MEASQKAKKLHRKSKVEDVLNAFPDVKLEVRTHPTLNDYPTGLLTEQTF